MRRVWLSCLAAAVLLATTAGGAQTQDEDLRMGDDPAYFERVEVPEVGLAMAFPSELLIEIEMDYGEIEEGDPETGYWNVIYAHDDGATWCDLTMYVSQMSDLDGLVPFTAERFAESGSDDVTVQWRAVSLPLGEAYRIDVQDPDRGEYSSVYLFDADSARYNLSCMSDERDARDWMDVAETIEWLPDTTGAEPRVVEPEVVDPEAIVPDEPGPEVVFAVPPYDLQWRHFGDADLTMLLPADWQVEVPLEVGESMLPDAYAEAGPASHVDVLSAESETGDWCLLRRFEGHPMPFDEHAAWDEAMWTAGVSQDMSIERRAADLDGRPGWRIDLSRAGEPGGASIFLIDDGARRYELQCGSSLALNPSWDAMAASVTPGLERFELVDAGVAISLAPAWEVETEQEHLRATLPPEYGEAATVPLTSYLRAFEHDEVSWCALYRFDEMPLSVDEQAAWLESLAVSDPDDPATVDIAQVRLPVGDAVRVFKDYADSADSVGYLFDLDGYRYDVACGGETVPDDIWLSVAQTVERLGVVPTDDRPPGVPADAAAWYEAGPFESLIPVDETRVMRAWCERALWIEFPDETFAERVECTLSDEPVDPSQSQGEIPAETVTVEGGACEWVSDFWVATDGSDVWADSWSITIEPDGSVTGTSVYGAELLECPE